MATWLIILLLFMLVTGASFTSLARGALGLLLKWAVIGFGMWLLFTGLSGFSPKHMVEIILGVGGTLVLAEEIWRWRWNKAHPFDRIDAHGKSSRNP